MGTPEEKESREIASLFKRAGFLPVVARIPWNKKAEFADMKKYVAIFLEQYKNHHKPGDKTCVFGFSFGAMIAFITAPKIKPETLVLGSMSPSFKEDIPRWRDVWKKELQKISYTAKDLYSATTIAKKISSKTYAVVGSKEAVEVLWRAAEAVWKIPNAKLVIAQDAEHKVGQAEYRNTLKEIIDDLAAK
ncbi:MAG TPA: hypothetical protein VFT82_01615 [Candidatus Paceibacterota bacterium]|nr:hypothetical protein [Candidatus Paceibacterota bacterium]